MEPVDLSRARLTVRELGPDEAPVRVRYFHDASDEHLRRMGVDRALLPPVDEWIAAYRADAARPCEERTTSSLGWELDGEVVGFASIDRITFGDEAFFHLHLLDGEQRHLGLGAPFVRLSATRFVELFALRRLVSEPNAYNVAPHRALQRAGFRYERTYDTTPGRLNPHQPVTRWVLDATDLAPVTASADAVTVRPAVEADLPAITHLFNVLIPTTATAWRDHLADDDEMATWWADQAAAGHPVLVAVAEDEVVGYATWSGFRGGDRFPGYRRTVEHTIHVAGDRQGRGVGRTLLEALVAEAGHRDVHVMVGAVDSENAGSIAFHEALGFTVVGRLPEVGRKFDRWLDLVLLQRTVD